MLPNLDDALTNVEPLENSIYRGTLSVAFPKSSAAEAYRHIRTNLFYAMPEGSLKTLVVTSARPREGKTTTVTNLALVISQIGKRVLLVDCDLHRPSVHKLLGTECRPGVSDVLAGRVGLAEAVRPVYLDGRKCSHLSLLPAGRSVPNPADLVGSDAMRQLLAHVRAAYDWVILDTPPVLFVSDACVLAANCDGVAVVVRSGTCARSLLARTMGQLRSVRANMVGCVLNSMQVSRVGRHFSYYYYHGYSRYAKDYHSSYYGEEPEVRGHADDAADADVLHPVEQLVASQAQPVDPSAARADTGDDWKRLLVDVPSSSDRAPGPGAGE